MAGGGANIRSINKINNNKMGYKQYINVIGYFIQMENAL